MTSEYLLAVLYNMPTDSSINRNFKQSTVSQKMYINTSYNVLENYLHILRTDRPIHATHKAMSLTVMHAIMLSKLRVENVEQNLAEFTNTKPENQHKTRHEN